MKKILISHQGKAYLPEINAYKKYFNSKGKYFFYDSIELEDYTYSDFDAIWTMMGIDFSNHTQARIHEYSSLSTGNYKYIKNFIKKKLIKKPDLRIFLNSKIQKKMNFTDHIPYNIRDMGINNSFFNLSKNKEYDFLYLGAISYERKTDFLFNLFKNQLTKSTLLVIGEIPKSIYDIYKDVDNITFTGKVSYEDVALLGSKAIYGINYIPNIAPFNIQTSTKLLEYCAMGLKIVTNNYRWVNDFEKNMQANFFYFDDIFSNFTIENIQNHPYKIPNVKDLSWDNIIKKSAIEENLIKIL